MSSCRGTRRSFALPRSGSSPDQSREGCSPADVRLWREAIAGRTDAFGELFQRHAQAIFGYCLRRTASWSSAEELTSGVFLEALRRRTQTAPTGPSALPWLYAIALGLTRNHRRSLRRYHHGMAKMQAATPTPDHAETVSPGLTRQ